MTRIVSRMALGALLAGSAVIGAVACSGSSGGNSTPTPSCTGTPFTQHNLATLQSQIFTPTCAISGVCHLGLNPPSIIPGFSLSSGQTYSTAVGVNTSDYSYSGTKETYNGNYLPIVALNGSTSGSYLYLKVTASPGIYGLPMPYTGQALCQNQIDAIGAWIRAGAPNN